MNKRVFMTLIINEHILRNFAKNLQQAISYGFIRKTQTQPRTTWFLC